MSLDVEREMLGIERAKLRALQAAELRDLVEVWCRLPHKEWPGLNAVQLRIGKLITWAGYP